MKKLLILCLLAVQSSLFGAEIGLGTLVTKEALTNIVQGILVQGTNVVLELQGTGQIKISSGGTNSLGGAGDVTAGSNFGADNLIVRSDGVNKGVQSSLVTISDTGVVGVNVTNVGATYTEVMRFTDPVSGAYFAIDVDGSTYNPSFRIRNSNGIGLELDGPNFLLDNTGGQFKTTTLDVDESSTFGSDRFAEHTFYGTVRVEDNFKVGPGNTVTLSGDVNNWLPTDWYSHTTFFLQTTTSGIDISGLGNGPNGQIAFFHNKGPDNITFLNQSGLSSAQYRFEFGSDLVLAPNDSVILQYDDTDLRWRRLSATVASTGGTSIGVDFGEDGGVGTGIGIDYGEETGSSSSPAYVWFDFEENTGLTLTDRSGKGNDATAASIAWGVGADGVGSAMYFNGPTSSVLTDSAVTFTNNIVTVCAWVKWVGSGAYVLWSTDNVGATDNTFDLTSNTALSHITSDMQGDTVAERRQERVTMGASYIGYWTHVLLVYDNTTADSDVRTFINGVEQTPTIVASSHASTSNFASQRLYIGNGPIGLGFVGWIDDFRIYAGDISSQVSSIMADIQ